MSDFPKTPNPMDAFDLPPEQFAKAATPQAHPTTPASSLRLVVVKGPRHVGDRFDLTEGATRVLGRGEGSDIILEGQSVSRRHCAVRIEDGRCCVRDLGSRNGVLYRQKKVTACVVGSGEMFRIGDYTLRLVGPGTPPAAAAVPPSPLPARQGVPVGPGPVEDAEVEVVEVEAPAAGVAGAGPAARVAPVETSVATRPCPYCKVPVAITAVFCDGCSREIPAKPGVASLTGLADADEAEVDDESRPVDLQAATGAAAAVFAAAFIGMGGGWLVPLTLGGIVAIVLGLLARRTAMTDGASRVTRRLTLTALAVGAVALPAGYAPAVIVWHRESAARAACQNYLRGINGALRRFVDSRGSGMPERLEDLVNEGFMNRDLLRCPGVSDKTLGRYLYIPSQKLSDHPGNIVVYEDVGNHSGNGAYVLYLNGQVLWVEKDELVRQLGNTRKRLYGDGRAGGS